MVLAEISSNAHILDVQFHSLKQVVPDWSGWRVRSQSWHASDRNIFFYLLHLIFYWGLLRLRSGAICWTSECRNLFCLRGKYLIPVPGRIYRSAEGRHYHLTLSKSGADLKLLGDKYEVSCPALSWTVGSGSMQNQRLRLALSLSGMGCN